MGDLQSVDEVAAAQKIIDAMAELSPRQRRRVIDKARRRLQSRVHDMELEKKHLEHGERALHEAKDWVDQEENWQLQRAESSQLVKLRESVAQHQCIFVEDSVKAWLLDAFEGIQVFVVQHDWASALKGSDAAEGEIKSPADPAAFEFQLSGHRLIIIQHDQDYCAACLTKHGWVVTAVHNILPSDVPRSDQLVGQQIRAISIMLDASVAETEVVRAPHRLNQARERRGKLPLYDYHVIKLVHRHRVLPVDGDRERNSPRLHFRRGHWRHFDEHKTWINWTLVGDPDLGFIDKEYRL